MILISAGLPHGTTILFALSIFLGGFIIIVAFPVVIYYCLILLFHLLAGSFSILDLSHNLSIFESYLLMTID
jgi:hypothetical protein